MPIVGAKVEVWKDGVLIQTGYTDDTGKFLTTLEIGDYDIIISKEGYNTITKEELIGTRTQLIVNLPSLSVAVSTDALCTISLLKDYTTSIQDMPLSVSTDYETEVT